MKEKFFLELEKNLKGAQMKESAEQYLRKASLISALFGIFAWLITGLLLEEIIVSFFYGIVFAFFVFLLLIYLPVVRKKRIAEEIEGQIPFALMSIAAELNMNIAMEKCIENTAQTSKGRIAAELKRIVREHREKGKPLQQCLFNFSERIDSLNVKRCIAQLNNILEQGGKKEKGEAVKRIAREMLAKQKAESKEFSGKLVVFSLLFIAVSAIVPALFQSFIIVGSMILRIDFSPMQLLLIIAVLFPLLDIAVLLYIKTKTPAFLRD